ncbi:hypothetical protein F5Y06DRAFT_296716 [Hypoxylon sp. FL0890]|nr:hypothetical protein F5Y06DRAFT_296716 [Hypoxylon sp. FL0890]
MKYLLIFVASIVVAAAAHSWRARSILLDGYNIKPMTWRGSVKEGGPEMTFHGTIEEVAAQIRATEPPLTWSYIRDQHRAIRKRAEVPNITCDAVDMNSGAPLSQAWKIRDNLVHAPGTCGVEGGPGVCSRISCSGHAAAWLCNDNLSCIHPKCSDLAAHIDEIVDECQETNTGHSHRHGKTVSGQVANDDDYRVIVGYDDC